MLLAFYTCFFGGDSNWAAVIPPLPSTEHDCMYFTNNRTIYTKLESTGWIRIWMPDIPIHNDPVADAMATKELKACPYRFPVLSPYSHLCWLDSKRRITNLQRVLEMAESLTGDAVLAVTVNPILDTYTDAWTEYTNAIQYEKYAREKESYSRYITDRLEEGYANAPLRHSIGCWIVRKSPGLDALGATWYHHIQMCGIECQISWQFVCQRFTRSIVEFPPKYMWEFL
jgi:hypothetical protein